MENTEKIADAVIHLDSIKGKEHSLTEQVASKISQLIIERHLTTADKLPNEFELMEQLNVGRGTVREAVKL
ncbi:MAG: GntR family transcriptional regulator, partial [Ruthenibacterium sp.]